MKIKLFEYHAAEDLAKISEEWEDICDHCSRITPFQYPQWLIPWWEIFGNDQLRLITLREDGKLVGLGCFFIYKDAGKMRRCCFVGSGISDYLDITALDGYRALCARKIFDYLLEIRSEWDICDFQEIPEGSELITNALFNGIKITPVKSSTLTYKLINKKPFSYQIPKKMRNNLRRSEKKMNADRGFVLKDFDSENVSEMVNDLFSVHTLRWNYKNEAGVLSDENVKRFHLISSQKLSRKKIVRGFEMIYEKKPVAIYYIMILRSVAYAYLGGFDPALSEYSPGSVLLYKSIEKIIQDKQIDIVDFLRGEEEYKEYWDVLKKNNYSIIINNG